MFKFLTTVSLVVLLAACGTIQTAKNSNPKIAGPYLVEGTGKSFNDAKSDAFRKAIEQAVGVAVLAERESRDKKLITEYVLNHSSGYVDRFTVLDKQDTGGRHKVSVEVYVKTSTIVDDYVLYKSKGSNNFDGEQATAKVDTYRVTQETGIDMISAVLKDFPEKTFDVDVSQPEVLIDKETKKPQIAIYYSVRWSHKFLQSLAQVLNQVKDKDCTWFCEGVSYELHYLDEKRNAQHKTFYFNDEMITDLIFEKLYRGYGDWNPRYVAKIDFVDNYGNVLATACHFPNRASSRPVRGGLASIRYDWYGSYSEDKNGVAYNIDWQDSNGRQPIKDAMSRMNKVEVTIVRPEKCRTNWYIR